MGSSFRIERSLLNAENSINIFVVGTEGTVASLTIDEITRPGVSACVCVRISVVTV